jgi:hypothetical protein
MTKRSSKIIQEIKGNIFLLIYRCCCCMARSARDIPEYNEFPVPGFFVGCICLTVFGLGKFDVADLVDIVYLFV